MSLILTREMLAAAYDLIEYTDPFCKWNLPASDEVAFDVVTTRYRFGDCIGTGKLRIRISSRFVGRLTSLVESVAHEMVHLHMDIGGVIESDPHGPGFRKLAAQVCKVHGFDPKLF